jgi:putative Mn2+ efflux pump MntP
VTGWGSLAIVPAFGIDTLAVAVGFGTAGLADRRRLAVVVAAFEGAMPVLGAFVGGWLGRLASGYAVWGAAALLALLGLRELAEGWRELREDCDGDDDEAPPGEGAGPLGGQIAGWGLLLAGLSVSMDELGAGLAAGAARLPLRILVPALALQALVFTYAGLHAGAALRRLAGRYGEMAAGIALVAAAVAIVRLSGR